jgi:hypothetical protein
MNRRACLSPSLFERNGADRAQMSKPRHASPGEILSTEVTGDGTTGDLIPGTMPDAFMREVKANGGNRLISRYNQTSAKRLTAAGQTLVDNGLFTKCAAAGSVCSHSGDLAKLPRTRSTIRGFALSTPQLPTPSG